eukprot:tig00000989_g6079.t2
MLDTVPPGPTTPRPSTQASPRTRGLSLGTKPGGGTFKSFSRDAQLVQSVLIEQDAAHVPLFIGDLSHIQKPSTAPAAPPAGSPRPTTRVPRDENFAATPRRAPMSLQLDDLGRRMRDPGQSPPPLSTRGDRDRIPLKLESLPPLPPVSTPSVLERTPRGPGGGGGEGRYDVAQHAIRGAWSSASPGGAGVPRTGADLEAWLQENLVAAAQSKAGAGAGRGSGAGPDVEGALLLNAGFTFDQGLGALGLARGQLRGERMHADAIERLYRALYVYSVGFADVLQQLSEHVPERSKLIPKVWRAYMMLVEERQHLAFPSALATMVREQEEGLSSERRRHEAEVAALDARAEQSAPPAPPARAPAPLGRRGATRGAGWRGGAGGAERAVAAGGEVQQQAEAAAAAKADADRLRRELKREAKAMADVQARPPRPQGPPPAAAPPALAFRATLRATLEPRFAKFAEVQDVYQEALGVRRKVDGRSAEEGGGDAVPGYEPEPVALQVLFVKEDQMRAALQNEASKLLQDIRNETRARREVEIMLEESRAMIRTLGDQVGDLKGQLHEANAAHARAKRAFEESMMGRLAERERQVEVWRGRYETEAAEVIRLNDKLAEVLERVTASEEARAELEGALDRETAARSAALARADALEKELEAVGKDREAARAAEARLLQREAELRGALRTSIEAHGALRLAIQGEIGERVGREGELEAARALVASFREREAFMMEKILNQVQAIRAADEDRRKRAAEYAAAEGRTVEDHHGSLGPAPKMGEDVVKDLEYLTMLAGRETQRVGEAVFHGHMEVERLRSEFRRSDAERIAEIERTKNELVRASHRIALLEKEVAAHEATIANKTSSAQDLNKKLALEQDGRRVALKRITELQEMVDAMVTSNAKEAVASKEAVDGAKRELDLERAGKQAAEARIAKLNEELGRAARAKSETDALAARLKGELDAMRKVAALVPGLESKLAEERAGRLASEGALEETRRDLEEAQAAMREVEEEAGVLEAENGRLEAAKELLEAECARLVAEIGEVEHDIELAEQEAAECRAQSAADREALVAVERRYEQLRLWSLSGAEQREVALQKEIRALRQRISELTEAAKRGGEGEGPPSPAKRPASGSATAAGGGGSGRGRRGGGRGAAGRWRGWRPCSCPSRPTARRRRWRPRAHRPPRLRLPPRLPRRRRRCARRRSRAPRLPSPCDVRNAGGARAVPLQPQRTVGSARPAKSLEQQLAEMRQSGAVLEIKLEGEARARKLVEEENARLRAAHDQLRLRLQVQEKLAAARAELERARDAGADAEVAAATAVAEAAEAAAAAAPPETGPEGSSPPPVAGPADMSPRTVAGLLAAQPTMLRVPSPLATTPLPPPSPRGPEEGSPSPAPKSPREIRSTILERRAAREARRAAAEAAAAAAKEASSALTPLERAMKERGREAAGHAGYRNEDRELITAAADALREMLPRRPSQGSGSNSGATTPRRPSAASAPAKGFLATSLLDGPELHLAQAPPPSSPPPAPPSAPPPAAPAASTPPARPSRPTPPAPPRPTTRRPLRRGRGRGSRDAPRSRPAASGPGRPAGASVTPEGGRPVGPRSAGTPELEAGQQRAGAPPSR